MSAGSIQSKVGIERPEDATEQEGAEVIDFWSNAILSDMHHDLSTMTRDDAAAVAVKARRWFVDAWASAGPRERRFRIGIFTLQLFSGPGQRGRVLVEIDVLTGRAQ